jgi:hypothetical protein
MIGPLAREKRGFSETRRIFQKNLDIFAFEENR